MALVPMRLLLDHAAENNYGLPAYNVNNLERLHAIMLAAAETNSPVILQSSLSARKYMGDSFLRHLVAAAVETYPHIPIALHQDHGNSPAACFSAIRNGFTSVMMDGSLEEDRKTPASFEYNVRVTAETAQVAHALGISVEGELGCLGSLETGQTDKEDGHGAEGTLSREQLLTDPDQAVEFVERTQVDALAVAIGTSHGAYKFTSQPTGEVLAISRIAEINRRLPNTHLVMHGSSSVPQELQDMINQYGGEIPATYGVPLDEIRKGIKNGVRKVNIDTDNRLAITAAIREAAAKDPSNFDPIHFFKPSIEYAKNICAERYEALGAAGNASKIKQVSIDVFAPKYISGELAANPKKAVTA